MIILRVVSVTFFGVGYDLFFLKGEIMIIVGLFVGGWLLCGAAALAYGAYKESLYEDGVPFDSEYLMMIFAGPFLWLMVRMTELKI